MISHRINQPPALISRINHAWNMECNVDLVWSSSIFRMIKAASDIFNANTGYDQKVSSAADRLEAAGFTRIPYSDLNQLKVGDFIIVPGHMEFIPEVGKMFSATKDENGAATGGIAGDKNTHSIMKRCT